MGYTNLGVGDITQPVTRVHPGSSPPDSPATLVLGLSCKCYLEAAAVKSTGGRMLDTPVKSPKRKVCKAFTVPSWHDLT